MKFFRRKTLWFFFAFMPALLLTVVDATAEMSLSGFADTYHAVGTESPNDYLASRTRVRLEGRFAEDQTEVFASINAVQNDVVTDETGLELMESYLDYTDDGWDIRAGKQIIIWGTASGIQITDIVSPKDYSEFLARDFDDMRLAVDAIKTRFLGEESDLELIWIPTFREAVVPTEESPWYIAAEEESGITDISVNETIKPEKNLANSELALKYSLYLTGADLAFSLFHTWQDLPVYHKVLNGSSAVYSPEHHRLTFGAFEFSLPRGDFVFMGEMAMVNGRYYEVEDDDDESHIMKDSFDGYLGVDWSPGNNWSLSVQMMEQVILDYEKRIESEAHNSLVTFSISKKLFREKLTLSDMLYYNLTDEDHFNRLSFDYAMTDEFHVSGGVDVFGGDEDGGFGKYDKNDEVWFKLKISF